MKKLLLALALCFVTFPAAAQNCSGVFQAGQVCGAAVTGPAKNSFHTGASGHALPFLDGANTWSGSNQFLPPVLGNEPATKTYVDSQFPVPVSRGGTGISSFTANLPLLGNGTGALTQGTITGNTTKFATSSGTLINGHCVSLDANGNFVDAGGACTVGGGGGTVSSGTAGQIGVYTGSNPSTTIGGTNTVPSGTTWGGNVIPSAKGGTNADLSGAANKTIPVANGSGTFAASTATAWFDSAYCNTVGYLLVRVTGSWTCSQSSAANPIWWGADPTGVSDSAAAWNTMIATGVRNIVCTAGTYLMSSGTVTIPQNTNMTVTGPGGFGGGADGNRGAGGCIIKQTSTSQTMFTFQRAAVASQGTNLTFNGVYLQGPVSTAPVSYPISGLGTSTAISWKGVTNAACGTIPRCENNRLNVINSTIDGFAIAIYSEYSFGLLDNVRLNWNGYCFKGGYDASYWSFRSVTCTFNDWGVYLDNGQGPPISVTANAPTAAGSNVLHFISVPVGVFVGQLFVDSNLSNFGNIPFGTTVTAKTSNTVTISNNVTGSGIATSDVIVFGGNDGASNGIIMQDFFSCCNSYEDITIKNFDAVQIMGSGATFSGAAGAGDGSNLAAIHCQGCSNLIVTNYIVISDTGHSPNRKGIWLCGVKGNAFISGVSSEINYYGFYVDDACGYTSNFVTINNNSFPANTVAGYNGSFGVYNRIENNLIYNPVGGSSITLTSGGSYRNGPTPASIALQGTAITVGLVDQSGAIVTTICSSVTVCSFSLGPNELFNITYSSLTVHNSYVH